MTRDETEAFIRGMCAARLEHDIAAMRPFFHDDLVYVIEGLGGDDPNAVTGRVEGKEAFFDILVRMTDDWRWRGQTWRDVIVDGDKVAARYTLDMYFARLGHRWSTEVVNIITMKDGLIVELVEFIDTATASALKARANAEAESG